MIAAKLTAKGKALESVFQEMYRLDAKPLYLSLESATPEELDRAIQPVLGAFVNKASLSMPIRGPDVLPPDVRAKIDAGLPTEAPAKPKKPRKLLVMDLCVANMSHNTIPHANYASSRWARKPALMKRSSATTSANSSGATSAVTTPCS